jgi:ADP-dependent NAD(P)H-hydrate dehydratase / NAD(P)H-hydrate epimerase
VVVVAGKGNNGNDGRDAANRLRRRGVRVDVLDAATVPAGGRLPSCDLVVDAAYGTGFRGEYRAPVPTDPATPVLAVDIPSGVNGLTGEAGETAVRADMTITFAALKPGLVLHPGRERTGRIEVADIGLDCSRARTHLVEENDVREWLPERPTESHKWKAAVWVVAGSPGMTGAAILASRGAQRAGAGYVRLSIPGAEPGTDARIPVEVVGTAVTVDALATAVERDADRFRALVVGPGLGLGEATASQVRTLVAKGAVPVVVDGDGLTALGERPVLRGADATQSHPAPVILTPHDGEYRRLAGHPPGPDRIDAARRLAAGTGATVLLKGSTTIVAAPDGLALVTTEGDARLATAGTGDVLSGIIASLLAQGLGPLRAAAAGAWLHGRAAHLGFRRGLVAGDLVDRLPAVLADLDLARPERRTDVNGREWTPARPSLT